MGKKQILPVDLSSMSPSERKKYEEKRRESNRRSDSLQKADEKFEKDLKSGKFSLPPHTFSKSKVKSPAKKTTVYPPAKNPTTSEYYNPLPANPFTPKSKYGGSVKKAASKSSSKKK